MTITIGSTTLATVWNVTHQKAISELGQSGISVSSLSFDTLAPFYADTAAAVTCDMIPGITFYINSRSKSGGIVHVECLDGAALLDKVIQLTNADINIVTEGTPPNVKTIGKFVSAATIAAKIATYCKGLTASVPWSPTQYGFPLDYVQGKTYQQILTDISEVCAGFYTVITGNILTLKYLNEMDAVSGRPVHEIVHHSAVNVSGSFEYQAIDVVSSYETSTIGSTGAADFNTLTISNSLSDYVFPTYDAVKPDGSHYTHVDTSVTPDELTGIVQRSFDGWSCDNAVIGSVYPLADYAEFQTGEELRITEMSIRFIGNTILASLSGGIPSSGEIGRRSRREMEMDRKLTIGQTLCNITFSNTYGQSWSEQKPSQSQGGNS